MKRRVLTYALCGFALSAGAGSALAQQQAPPSFKLPIRYDSGTIQNEGLRPGVVISKTVHVDGAEWLRLSFRLVQLAGDPQEGTGAILRVTSFQDGAVQEMNAVHAAQWGYTTAYFNGDTVQIDVESQPGTGASRLILDHAIAGLAGLGKSQCGPVDDRVLSSDARAARSLPVGCTSWIFDDCAHCLGTAGHCFELGTTSVIEFNVPLSTATGALVHPPPQDQYAVDNASIKETFGGIGNDWGYFGVFANSNTGLTPFQKQGSSYHLVLPPAFSGGQQIRITGYGVDSSPLSSNQVQQTHVGAWTALTGTAIYHQADTTGGNSGSAVVHEQTGFVIGVHTNAGCFTDGTGSNSGTASSNAGWVAALNAPTGVCAAPAGGSAQIYCTAKVNSQGCTPQINVSGNPSLTLGAGSFTIGATVELNLQNGLLFYGFGSNSAPFQGGFLCALPPILRLPAQNAGGSSSGVDCSGSYAFDVGAFLASGTNPNIVCGSTLYAQIWGRDPFFAPPNTTSLTAAVQFTVGP